MSEFCLSKKLRPLRLRGIGRVFSLFKFLAAGLPSFLLALPINYLLVDHLGVPKRLAYLLVLIFQVSLNYFMCRFFVFKTPGEKSSLAEYARFMGGILLFRILDWCVYVVLVDTIHVYYLLAQILNVVLFSVAKFLFAEKLMLHSKEEGAIRSMDMPDRTSIGGGKDLAGISKKGRRWHSAAVMLMVIIAFLLRSYGLSHDLDEGKVYQPDTPKQIRAAQRFSNGVFYSEIGQRNYDGYPYFNSLISAGVHRVATGISSAWRQHLGVHGAAEVEEVERLHWTTRFVNVIFATLAVWILFRLALRVTTMTSALLATLFFTLSPLDVAACHYSSGDTTAAFFGLLSLLFSVRIFQEGRRRDYIIAAAACICSFSAKYHGALTAFSLILAHVLRMKSMRELFGWASLRKAGLVLITVVTVFFLTNPATLVRTSRGIRKIYEFLQFSTQFGQSPEMLAMSRLEKFFFILKLNAPVFARFLSPTLFVFSLVGIFLAFFRSKARSILAVLPVVYILIGLSGKTAGNPVYSTLVTPVMILLGMVAIFDLMLARRWFPAPQMAGGILIVVSLAWVLNSVFAEMFFFRHNDTRLLAEHWVRENIPASFRVHPGRYSLLSGKLRHREGPFTGDVWVRSDRRDKGRWGYVKVCQYDLESDALPYFRNFSTEIYVKENREIKREWHLPVFQKLPSRCRSDLIFVEPPDFFRSPRVIAVRGTGEIRKTLVSPNPVEDLLMVVKASPPPRSFHS